MIKKMMLLAMAVGALAAFTAPVAMGNSVTDTSGKVVNEITAFSSNLTTTTAAGTLACNQTDLFAAVDNNASNVTLTEIEGTSTFNGGECPVLNEKGEVVTGAIITEIGGEATLAGGNGTASFNFEYDLTVAPGVSITCEFHTSGSALTYTAGPQAVLTIPGAALVGTDKGETPPGSCPKAGTLKGSLTYDGKIDG